MTLDEAIKHAEEVAEAQMKSAEMWKDYSESKYEGHLAKKAYDNCIKNAEEHRQLAEWLRELKKLREQTRWIPVTEKLPEYGVPVLTYDGFCYCVEKRIPAIRDYETGEPISGEWWVSDDYVSDSEYYPNLRDGACIAWMPLPESYKAESEDNV